MAAVAADRRFGTRVCIRVDRAQGYSMTNFRIARMAVRPAKCQREGVGGGGGEEGEGGEGEGGGGEEEEDEEGGEGEEEEDDEKGIKKRRSNRRR